MNSHFISQWRKNDLLALNICYIECENLCVFHILFYNFSNNFFPIIDFPQLIKSIILHVSIIMKRIWVYCCIFGYIYIFYITKWTIHGCLEILNYFACWTRRVTRPLWDILVNTRNIFHISKYPCIILYVIQSNWYWAETLEKLFRVRSIVLSQDTVN